MGAHDGEEQIASKPGLTLEFNKLEDKFQQSSLYSFLDSIFSVAIFEQVDLTKTINNMMGASEEINYFAKPFEAFCKENLSFVTKLLYATKFATGIDFTLKQFGILEDRYIDKNVHTTEYKALVVRATPTSIEF